MDQESPSMKSWCTGTHLLNRQLYAKPLGDAQNKPKKIESQ
jgi:hypothetical protein